MRKIFFTVGPTERHPKLDAFIRDALRCNIVSISHRGEEFSEIYRHAVESLRKLLGVPKNFHVFFLGSATEAMERIIENSVERRSVHFVNGAFSKRFYVTAVELRKRATKVEVARGASFDFSKTTIPRDAELIALTHNETATGVSLSMSDVYALRKKHPNVLIALDIVSSAPYVRVDYRYVDCAFFSVQKGFGLPSGLGVLFVNERCIEKANVLSRKKVNIGSFHNYPSLLASEAKLQTPETPNVLGMYLLGRVADDYLATGIERIRKETEQKAKLLYDFFDSHPDFASFVKDRTARSSTVIVAEAKRGARAPLALLARNGIIAGPGYGEFAGRHIRIGNFPMHRLSDVKRITRILS